MKREIKIFKTEALILSVVIILGISITNVIASGFSPTSLVFNLNVGEQDCKTITITSDSETISVSDLWAKNKDVEWKVSLFNESAGFHGISIDYDDKLNIDERQVEVCLSGNKIGEYHGVVLLKQGQEGNSIVQMGVWLKVTITEKQEEITTPAQTNAGGSSGGGGSIPAKTNTTNSTTQNNNIKTEDSEIKEKAGVGITGAVIGGIGNPKIIGITLAIIVIAGIIIYNKRKNKTMDGFN